MAAPIQNGIPTWINPNQAMQTAPASTQQPGLLSRIGQGFKDVLNDPARMAQLQAAFNTMRFEPDPYIAMQARETIQAENQKRQTAAQGNRTVEYLRSIGRDDLARVVEANPSMAMEALKTATAQPATPDSIRALELRAASAGLAPGTPEYQQFMLTGGKPQEMRPSGVLSKDQIAVVNQVTDDLKAPMQEFNLASEGFNAVEEFANNPGGVSDYALTVAFAKILDPGSVVREGEQAAISRTGSLPDAIKSQLINALKGEGALPIEVRNQIIERAYSLQAKRTESFKKQLKRVENTLPRYGITTEDLMLWPEVRDIDTDIFKVPEGVDPSFWGRLTPSDRRRFLDAGREQ